MSLRRTGEWKVFFYSDPSCARSVTYVLKLLYLFSGRYRSSAKVLRYLDFYANCFLRRLQLSKQ
jgi:hypothetical protein